MKSFIPLILIVTLLLTGCVSETAASGGIVLRGNQPTEPPTDGALPLPPDETIVYVTATGKKYHTKDCPSLSSGAIPVTLEQALTEGKQPCSRCHPSKETLD